MKYAIKKRKYDKLVAMYLNSISKDPKWTPRSTDNWTSFVSRIVYEELLKMNLSNDTLLDLSYLMSNNKLIDWINSHVDNNPNSEIKRIYDKCIEVWNIKLEPLEVWLARKLNISKIEFRELIIIL